MSKALEKINLCTRDFKKCNGRNPSKIILSLEIENELKAAGEIQQTQSPRDIHNQDYVRTEHGDLIISSTQGLKDDEFETFKEALVNKQSPIYLMGRKWTKRLSTYYNLHFNYSELAQGF